MFSLQNSLVGTRIFRRHCYGLRKMPFWIPFCHRHKVWELKIANLRWSQLKNFAEHDMEVVWVVATQIFFIFTPIWGNDPIWLIFFRWVETTNQLWMEVVNEYDTNYIAYFDLFGVLQLPEPESSRRNKSCHSKHTWFQWFLQQNFFNCFTTNQGVLVVRNTGPAFNTNSCLGSEKGATLSYFHDN